MFNSDIRSMINYIQSNEQMINDNKIIQSELWERLIISIQCDELDSIINFINTIGNEYNIEKNQYSKNFFKLFNSS